MNLRRANLRLVPLCLAAALLAACSGSDSAAGPQDPGTPPPAQPQLRCAPEPAVAAGAGALEAACAARTEAAA